MILEHFWKLFKNLLNFWNFLNFWTYSWKYSGSPAAAFWLAARSDHSGQLLLLYILLSGHIAAKVTRNGGD